MNSSEPKPSRYRSVRNAAAAANNVDAAPNQAPVDSGDPTDTINRSRSRYHRKVSSPQSPPLPQSPILAHTSPVKKQPSNPVRQGSDPVDGSASSRLVSPSSGERILTPRGEGERRRRLDENSASRQAQATGSRGRERSANERPDVERKIDSAHRNDSPMFDGTVPAAKAPGSEAPQQILATTVNVQEEKSASCFGGLFRRKKSDMILQKPEKPMDVKSDEPQFIKAGGGGIVPGTDAPKSAVNSGERRVLVECNRSSMQFPVDPTTTPADLLQSAANCFSDAIDPKTYVLLEYFNKVGVQRPLRRYEHVREVMNSWDDDRQNSLMVLPAAETGSDPSLLLVSHVSHQKPGEKAFDLHYSQRVGKWNRRYIIVRQDGQVVAKKNPNASDKDATNVCHLSDFDIYTPTVRQSAKKIRPPKKLCFAIKSQQKTSMFESTTNFVHFFCTADKTVAINFYTAVQSWRSWYLVNMKGEGRKQPKPAEAQPARGKSVKHADHARNTSNHSMESHYQLGSYKPLMDTEQLNFRTSMSQDREPSSPPQPVARRMSKRDKTHPPPSMAPQLGENEPLVKLVDKRLSVDEPRTSDTFATGGLLGRSYSQRQRDQAAREEASSKPFTNGASLLNSDAALRPQTSDTGVRRNVSIRHSSGRPDSGAGAGTSDIRRQNSHRRGTSMDIGRSNSTRVPQKPLVDLTPSYKEPPQHQRKGRGYNPSSTAAPGGGTALIDAATSPENPLGIPPSTDWRGRNGTRELHSTSHDALGSQQQRARSASRTRANPAAPQAARFQNTTAYAALTGGPDVVPQHQGQLGIRQVSGGGGLVESARLNSMGNGNGIGSGDGFVPGGLLEQAGAGWGAGHQGRGVVTSQGNGRPLVDLTEGSKYAQGSLLASRERVEGPRAPVIDRDA